MNLPEYIKELGIEKFSNRFGVKMRTALSWQYKARRPRREVAQKIIENSPLTWESIYGEDVSSGRSTAN